jgi:voltage-gated sodium channel
VTTAETQSPAILQRFIEAPATRRFIMAVIVANAAVLGLETAPSIVADWGTALRVLDLTALAIFVVEIALKLIAYRARYFRDPWNIFDFVIVGVSLAPAGQGISVMRALRILRAFRLISAVPRMRLVMEALLTAIPSMGSVCLLLVLVFYVASVMATKLFGSDFDAWFGTVGRSAYSLFQIMTLESWSMGIVRPVMELYPYAWAFFVPFILIVTFAVLNLFIAIIVNSMHEVAREETEEIAAGHDAVLVDLTAEIAELRREVAALNAARDPERPRRPGPGSGA